MPTIFENIWDKITGSPSYVPAQINIKPENTDRIEKLAKPFSNDHYFVVKVNEMYLSYERKWFNTYDPLVFVVTEFSYNGEEVSVPFVVGPSLLNKKLDRIPDKGMIFKDTIVAGLHPFKGGTFTVSIVLARLKQKDYLRKILKLIESTAATYTGGFSTIITQYSKVANVVMDGIDTLLDSQEVEPIIGYRTSVRSDIDDFNPGYYAIINQDEAKVDRNNFFVTEDSLQFSEKQKRDSAKNYRDDDYVLYSIMSGNKRNDYESLPFHKDWKELVTFIGNLRNLSEDDKAIINAKLFSLQSTIVNSPDLTRQQVDELIEDYWQQAQKLKSLREKRYSAGEEPKAAMPAEEIQQDEWKKKMRDISLKILKS